MALVVPYDFSGGENIQIEQYDVTEYFEPDETLGEDRSVYAKLWVAGKISSVSIHVYGRVAASSIYYGTLSLVKQNKDAFNSIEDEMCKKLTALGEEVIHGGSITSKFSAMCGLCASDSLIRGSIGRRNLFLIECVGASTAIPNGSTYTNWTNAKFPTIRATDILYNGSELEDFYINETFHVMFINRT